MQPLKLVALDEQDLSIISAHVQDAVMKVGDLKFVRPSKQFVVAMNRFAWENSTGFFKLQHQRRRSVMHFDRVLSVKTAGIDLKKPEEVLSLLAVRFAPSELPAGTVELDFSGDATIRLEVECIEARLTDLGSAWETTSRPAHKI